MHTDGFSRIAAVKLLHQRWSENQEVARRMRDEARLLGWLRHRNIVDVIDLTTIGGRVAVVMEYLEAVDLKSIGGALQDRGEPMSMRAALEILAFVASALDAAYNRPPYQGERPLRVIHRDLKPSNVMVDETGTVKVLDFGVARADFDNRESHTQELQFGSIDYMPPERLFHEPETPASDVYSLGATFFEILALEKLGKARGHNQRHTAAVRRRLDQLRPSLGPAGGAGDGIEQLLLEMLSFEHADRPGAADVVHRARQLARSADGEGLIEWAERVIPPLVKDARDAPREPNALTDCILAEDTADSRGFEQTDPGLTDPKFAEISERSFLGPPPPVPALPSPPRPAEPSPGPILGAPPPAIGLLPASPGGLRATAPPSEGDADATLIYADIGHVGSAEPAPAQVVLVAVPVPPAPAAPAPVPAAPVARKRGPPPSVSLNPLVPVTEDPGLLSAPFPRHMDATGRALPLSTVTAADLAEPAGPPRANPVVRSAITRTNRPPATLPDPDEAPGAVPLPPPRGRTIVPVDDDSDAMLVTRVGASPTLIFPIGGGLGDDYEPSSQEAAQAPQPRPIPPAHAEPPGLDRSPPSAVKSGQALAQSVDGDLVDEADETVPAMALRPRPDGTSPEDGAPGLVAMPKPFPPQGSALGLPPPKPQSPAPPDPGQVSEARLTPTRSRPDGGPIIVQRVIVGDQKSEIGGSRPPAADPIRPAIAGSPIPPADPIRAGIAGSPIPPADPIRPGIAGSPIPPATLAAAAGASKGDAHRPPIVLRAPRTKLADLVVEPAVAGPSGMPRIAPRPPAPTPPKRTPWLAIALGAMLCLALVGTGALYGAWTYVIAPYLASASDTPAAALASAPDDRQTSTSAPPTGSPGASANEPAEATHPDATPGGLRFVSSAASTSRLTVTCDGHEYTGTTWVDVPTPPSAGCTVRAMLTDRTRLYADVAAPEARVWTCFAGGSRTCTE